MRIPSIDCGSSSVVGERRALDVAELGDAEQWILGGERRAGDRGLELADVARPAVAAEQGLRLRRESLERLAPSSRGFSEMSEGPPTARRVEPRRRNQSGRDAFYFVVMICKLMV